MEANEKVIVMGEDVELAYVFGDSKGLMDRFGKDRVRDTPISELGIVGAGVGAAMAGYRPIIEIMFMDFIMLAMDPLVNQAAKLRYMLGGQLSVPLVVRTPSGGGVQYGSTHKRIEIYFPVPMRANPTVTINALSSDSEVSGSYETVNSVTSSDFNSDYGGRLKLATTTTSASNGAPLHIYPTNSTGYIQGDSEL